jgi:hypothetical protein
MPVAYDAARNMIGGGTQKLIVRGLKAEGRTLDVIEIDRMVPPVNLPPRSRSGERHRLSVPPRDDRHNAPRRVAFTDTYAAQTTKTKKATTVAQTQNAPAPAQDPNCKVFLPDNTATNCARNSNATEPNRSFQTAQTEGTRPSPPQ